MDVGRFTDEPLFQAPVEPDLEAAVRGWLKLVIERSTLEELGQRPLGPRIEDARLLLESVGARQPPESVAARRGGLREEIDRQLAAHRATGEPFAVGLLALEAAVPERPSPPPSADPAEPARRFRRGDQEDPSAAATPERWADALERASGERELVLAAGHGATAVVLPGATAESARATIDRLRVAAWRLLDQRGPLVDAGVAACPEDGASAHDLLASAEERLDQAAGRPRELPGELTEPPLSERDGARLRVLPLR